MKSGRWIAILAAFALLVVVGGKLSPAPASAQAELVLDVANDTSTGISFSAAGSSIYQSFIPSVSPVAAVDIRFRAGGSFPESGVDTTLKIRAGNPGGTELGSLTAHVPTGPGELDGFIFQFEFSSAITVTPGATYVIEWVSLHPSELSWMGSTTNPYADGTMFGSGGTAIPANDLSFNTYTSSAPTPTPTPTPVPIFVVTNTNDSGAGSLRQAIIDANSQEGEDTIEFSIPGTGPHTISITTADLPTITEAVTIDGTTQPGYAGTPIIVLAGSGAFSEGPETGIHVDNQGSTIRGLVINGFTGNGILIEGTGGNRIVGNYMGTDASGTIAVPNGFNGIQIVDSPDNWIGTLGIPDRNVISGNEGEGIRVDGELSTVNHIEGNYVGTDVSGTIDLGNSLSGIYLRRAPNNFVVGNLVSGNDGFAGIAICGNEGGFCGGAPFGTQTSDATSNTLQGNLVGIDAAGTAALGNSGFGLSIDGAPLTAVGGTNPGEGNTISGNGSTGMRLFNGATASSVVSNYIGTDATGSVAIPNNGAGVSVEDSPSNFIGKPGEGNLISGNGVEGVYIAGNNSTGNLVQGNLIGTDFSGTAALGNAFGLIIDALASNNTIGGNEPGAGNVISGSEFSGVGINPGSTGNFVQGNFIGTDITGMVALGNSESGVFLLASNTKIGGTGNGAGNVISGNGFDGVVLNIGVSGTVIQGNFIGTDATGTLDLGNAFSGVAIADAPDNLVGGTVPGARNVISGNDGSGVAIGGIGATDNLVQGNYIGTDVSGSSGLGNGFNGVDIIDSPNNTVESNKIAYNDGNGVLVQGEIAEGNTISRNSIHSNGLEGIENADGGNGELTPPIISAVLGDRIEGTAPLGSRVEVFADDVNEGRTFLGFTTADLTTGEFVCSAGEGDCVESFSGPNLTATATEFLGEFGLGSTSEFSQAVPWVPDNCELNDTFSEACDVATELDFGFNSAGSFQSWISGPGDVDWFTFDLPASTPPGSLITVSLSGVGGGDLPANFDLVVLAKLDEGSVGSSPIQGVPIQGVPIQGVPIQGVPIQGVPIQGVPIQGVPIQGVPIQGVPIQGVPIQGVPIQGVPIQGVPIQGVPIQGVGFHAGNQAEETSTLFRSGMNGTYFVLVWSSTGEFSTGFGESPYEVTVSIESVTVPACTNPSPTNPVPNLLVLPSGVGSNPQTLILINRARMAAYHGDAPTDSLQATLNTLAINPLVQGVFLDLGDSLPDMQAAYNRWDATACDPEIANRLTLEIKKEILQALAVNPSISNLVIVGNDLIVPFRRVPDNIVRAPLDAVVPNEFDYQSESNPGMYSIGITPTDGFNATLATLRLQYFLSDDFYADTAPVILQGGNELSVPDMPLGRLVETPLDIEKHINVFLTQGGVIESGSTATSLTTGYDFLIDAANAINASLSDFSNDTLITDSWQASDFLAAYANLPNAPDVTSANAHFDHFRFADPAFLPSGPMTGDFVTTADLLEATANIAGTLFYSVGCHAGFNFWDSDAPSEAGRFDWAQILVGKGASLVGSWGFAYGDDETIAYTEELMLRFTNQFGIGSLGQSLVEAKRGYLLNQAILDPVHEKILMQTVFYGLPMWQLPSTVQTPSSGLTETHTETTKSLTVRAYAVEVVAEQLQQISTSRGDYFSLAGQTQTANYHPVQPQGSIDVSGVVGKVAHGVLFTGGSYSDIQDFNPVITMPSWTVSVPEFQFVYEGWDPARFWSLAQLERSDGTFDERLSIVPGQFLMDPTATDFTPFETFGTQRLYDSLNFSVFYNSESAEFQPPIITRVNAGVESNPGTFFSVDVEDDASGVVRVIVTYTKTDIGTSWQSVDLVFNPGTGSWEGSIPATDPIVFFVQALDAAGNVGMFAANGYFAPIAVSVSGPAVIQLGEPATFTATLPAGLSDPNILWEFGDGAVAEGASTVDHIYSLEGGYTVTVRVTDAGGHLGQASLNLEVVAPNARIVEIDVRPGVAPNKIRLAEILEEAEDDEDEICQVEIDDGELELGEGVMPVAILTDGDFDALSVSPASLRIGDPSLGETSSPIGHMPRDVDGDGDDDLLIFFCVPSMVGNGTLAEISTELVLTGQTLEGRPIAGADKVVIVTEDDGGDDDAGDGSD